MPSSYPLRPLDEFGKWVGGGTPSKANKTFWTKGTVPWVSPTDMGTDRLSATIENITEAAVSQSTTTVVPKNSTVLVVRSGILRKKIPIAITEVSCAINQDLKALIPFTPEEGRYLFHTLRAYEQKILARTQKVGTTVESLDFPLVRSFRVPDPDRAAKIRIAEILDAIDDAVLETDAVIDKLQAVSKGMVADLFSFGLDSNGELRKSEMLERTAIGMLPRTWRVDRLDTVFSVFGGKRLPAGHTYAMEATRFRYFRVTDFFGEASRPDQLPCLEARTFKALQRYEITDGALAISIAGSIGRFHPFKNDSDLRVILTENAARLEPKKTISPDFYARFLNSLPIQKQVELEIGTGGGVPKLALHRIQALQIVDVPPDEQDEISRRLNSLELEIQAYRIERAKLTSLREGLRDDLLSGRKLVAAVQEAFG